MLLHPAEIAAELKSYPFFKSFNPELLLQISTMVQPALFQKGDLILQEGHVNTKLFFIRKGVAEVLLAGEVVTILQTPGEVMGEMSVVSQNQASSTIRAASDLECFVIDSTLFEHVHPKDKDHFLYLIHKVYSIILCDRLMKTNEKARLFEIANRELYQAQKALDTTGDKKALLVEPDKKQLVLAKMAVGCTGVSLDAVQDRESALEKFNAEKYDAVVVDSGQIDLFNEFKAKHPETRFVAMCPANLLESLETLMNKPEIDFSISRDLEDRTLTVRLIMTALTKVLNQDYFGIEKYLAWGVDVQKMDIKGSKDRLPLNAAMEDYFKSMGIRSSILSRVFIVAEEMMMNAVYDAPTNIHGKSIFNHLTRQNEIILDTHQISQLSYACDGTYLAVSVCDPFGALTKKHILNYLKSCYDGKAGSLNEGKGGAGRGLHQILENSDQTIFNVKEGLKTEVIALFRLEAGVDSKPRFHYFFSRQ